jgi:hypothetical protein
MILCGSPQAASALAFTPYILTVLFTTMSLLPLGRCHADLDVHQQEAACD